MRNAALDAIARACHAYGGRSNMPHRWQALCKENNVPDESSVAALNNWTATFNALIGDLKTNVKKGNVDMDLILCTCTLRSITEED